MSVSQIPYDTEAYRHTLCIEGWAGFVPLAGHLSCAPVLESYSWKPLPQFLKAVIVRHLRDMQKWLTQGWPVSHFIANVCRPKFIWTMATLQNYKKFGFIPFPAYQVAFIFAKARILRWRSSRYRGCSKCWDPLPCLCPHLVGKDLKTMPGAESHGWPKSSDPIWPWIISGPGCNQFPPREWLRILGVAAGLTALLGLRLC